ncbi:endonuclease/exonuclease/phosphatase family protein [Tamlana agarivorans]|uniref:Endonuclease/exonuclease/phosphatase family protein n=1 Tax=Pseudotamlana agarivorans TaxID=481183 RepID=A0ACC5U7W4_9FLAO|nr:endonuclease/exonuclease/phosphatase family protein [Tamlana agarivorans]MBU2950370.1 endonuclease/exonuclease/phosphatase family protein [Tamlana agarivorans]
MGTFFLAFSAGLIILSILPFSKNQHWFFRVPEFLKIQLLSFQIIALLGMFVFSNKTSWFWLLAGTQTALIIYHIYILARFTKFYKTQDYGPKQAKTLKVISTNIYQYNQDFERFKTFIKKENPDLFITIESNSDWEKAMRDLEQSYPHTQKITLENTYGMHLYSKLPFEKVNTHYFVANDIPSIEAHLKTKDGEDFVLFSVHPPPPSPTEEDTSKERDGDLLSIAKRVKELNKPTMVIGDFNTVAWSKIAALFRKNSGLIDGRTGRGILSTYHAKYWFFRAPLDLVFHSTTIFLKELKLLEHIGSDHFPICCIFCVDSNAYSFTQKKEVEHISSEEKDETNALIQDGKDEINTNRMAP